MILLMPLMLPCSFKRQVVVADIRDEPHGGEEGLDFDRYSCLPWP